MVRESFLLYKSFYEPIKSLSLEAKGALLEAIYEYQVSGVEPPNTSPAYMAFLFFKNQFRLDDIKYNETCEANKKNIGKRWNKKNTNLYERIPSDTKHTYNEKENVTEKENEKEKEKENVNEKEKDIVIPHSLQLFVKNLKEVSRIKTQLTAENCQTLISNHGEEMVKEILLAMENTKGITNKYTSVYLTINSWALRRKSDVRITDPGATQIKRTLKPITHDQL